MKIRVGLRNGKSKVVEINKPFDYITAADIREKAGQEIVGWVRNNERD